MEKCNMVSSRITVSTVTLFTQRMMEKFIEDISKIKSERVIDALSTQKK
jgi:hypothetical protein